MRYALVTGGTKGIGRATVERLLDDGYYVFVNYAHDKCAALELEQYFKDRGIEKYKLVCADLTSIEAVDVIVETIMEVTSHIDTIVMNAGITDYDAFGSVTWDNWNSVMNANVSVPFFLIQKMREMIVDGGSIVLVSSILGHYPHARSVSYGVSKAGFAYLAKLLVKEFADKQIRVNAINPGFTDTDWQKSKSEEHRKRIADKVALKRFAKSEEIADMICAIIKNTYINGSVVDIDGGYSYF